jgi:hypothetical protein
MEKKLSLINVAGKVLISGNYIVIMHHARTPKGNPPYGLLPLVHIYPSWPSGKSYYTSSANKTMQLSHFEKSNTLHFN